VIQNAVRFRLFFVKTAAFIIGLVVILAVSLLLSMVVAQAQTAASRLMLAAVTDPRGHTIVDIGPDDFVVQEGTASREILSVRVADYPIVVVLDSHGSSAEDFALIQQATVHFIERLGNDRPIIVATSGTNPRLLATFDDDRKTVLERVNALEPEPAAARDTTGARGFSRANPMIAAALAATTLHATGTLFSSIVILSAAGDEEAEVNAETTAPIIESGAIVHVIAKRPPASSVDRSLQAMRAIANQTRGEFTPIYAAASFQAALDRLVDRLSSEMLIEYLVPPGSKPVDAKIGIRLAGARVRGLGVAPK
jgi:VWA domain-containing protein